MANGSKSYRPSFVEIGQEMEAGQVLCLVEAMKMMNEQKSPIHGIIRRIHGKDGELLEYDAEKQKADLKRQKENIEISI